MNVIKSLWQNKETDFNNERKLNNTSCNLQIKFEIKVEVDSENIVVSIISSESSSESSTDYYYFVHYQSPLLYYVTETFHNIHQY